MSFFFSILRRAAFENRTEERSFQVFKKTLAHWQPGFVIDCFQKRSDSRRRSKTKGRHHNGNSEADRRHNASLISEPYPSEQSNEEINEGGGVLQPQVRETCSFMQTKGHVHAEQKTK